MLRGDRIVNTPYEVLMATDHGCKFVCNTSDYPLHWNSDESSVASHRIQHQYSVHLYVVTFYESPSKKKAQLIILTMNVLSLRLIDNLPCATRFRSLGEAGQSEYEHGYKLGFVEDGQVQK